MMKIIIHNIESFLLFNQKRIRTILFMMVAIISIICGIFKGDGSGWGMYFNWVFPFGVCVLIINMIIKQITKIRNIVAVMIKYLLYFIKYFSILYLSFFWLMFYFMVTAFSNSTLFFNIEFITIFLPILSLLLL